MTKKSKSKKVIDTSELDYLMDDIHNLSIDLLDQSLTNNLPVATLEESISVSDFECSATDLLELSSIVESIVSSRR